jgi:protein involved in polysaccharide export with SLBB domain
MIMRWRWTIFGVFLAYSLCAASDVVTKHQAAMSTQSAGSSSPQSTGTPMPKPSYPPDTRVIWLRENESAILKVNKLSRVSITNPRVADVVVLGPTELRIDGITAAVTTMYVWDAEGRNRYSVFVESARRPTPEVAGSSKPYLGSKLLTERSWGYSVPPNYVLGPRDRLKVHVFGNIVDEVYDAEVNSCGRVAVPSLGELPIGGTRYSALPSLLEGEFGKYLKNFRLSVLITRPRVDPASTMAVKVSGTMQDVEGAHLLQPGDGVDIHLYLNPLIESTISTHVNANGDLAIPNIGEVRVVGSHRAELDGMLHKLLELRLKDPILSDRYYRSIRKTPQVDQELRTPEFKALKIWTIVTHRD